jgi:hypothetical protein
MYMALGKDRCGSGHGRFYQKNSCLRFLLGCFNGFSLETLAGYAQATIKMKAPLGASVA